ncbi:MAG: hypothetical protein KGZ39_05055 [Simkania sp.]|nr:hypothetical protein [Simkania sp.]
MHHVDGKTVTQCFEVVSRVGSEIEALSLMLKDMLNNALKDNNSSPYVLAGSDEYDEQYDESGWVCTDMACSFPLKSIGKGKKNIERYIGFQISLLGNHIKFQDSNEPLLHVFCWGDACSFEENNYLGFPLVIQDDESFNIINDRLLLWDSEDLSQWNKSAWTFSLRLIALNSPDDLMNHIIKPVFALLNGQDVILALHDNLPALLKYPQKEILLSG